MFGYCDLDSPKSDLPTPEMGHKKSDPPKGFWTSQRNLFETDVLCGDQRMSAKEFKSNQVSPVNSSNKQMVAEIDASKVFQTEEDELDSFKH